MSGTPPRGAPERPAIITYSSAAYDWQPAAAELVTDPAELCRLLDLDPDRAGLATAAGAFFPLKVPRSYVARMRRGDPADPLLRQVLTHRHELAEVPGFGADPLEEDRFTPVPGILHKYRGRVLLMVTGACHIHCRYCFRRHFPYQEHVPNRARLDTAVDWLAARPDVTEVILSGGDPLSLSDRRLADVLERLAAVSHLRRLRIHTRVPVVMPERVTERLARMLAAAPWPVAMVLHANHGNELAADDVARALARLREARVTLLNQAVLLAGINDTLEAQCALAEALFACGVLPYYLHQLDAVAGAAHFAVTDEAAVALHRAMQAHLPGYLVPRLVRERPGADGKTWINAHSADLQDFPIGLESRRS